MKKVFLFLALFAASAMIMTSCGGSETTPAAGDEPAATQVDEPTTNDATATDVDDTTATDVDDATATDVDADAPAAALGDAAHGEEVYNMACSACHATGVAGAAKLDDKARWETSAANGLATLYEHAVGGFTGDNGMMPAKGGNATLTDQDVHDAVTYMVGQAGVEVK